VVDNIVNFPNGNSSSPSKKPKGLRHIPEDIYKNNLYTGKTLQGFTNSPENNTIKNRDFLVTEEFRDYARAHRTPDPDEQIEFFQIHFENRKFHGMRELEQEFRKWLLRGRNFQSRLRVGKQKREEKYEKKCTDPIIREIEEDIVAYEAVHGPVWGS
jgi:hypothetical protein